MTALVELADARKWLQRVPAYDLLLTDPPHQTDVWWDDPVEFVGSWLPTALTKLRSTGWAVVSVGAGPEELRAYLEWEPTQVLAWPWSGLPDTAPRDVFQPAWNPILVWRGEDARPLPRVEPDLVWWSKPDQLPTQFVLLLTTEDELVVDPFAGGGAHLRAAATLGRRALGCDVRSEAVAECKLWGAEVVW